LPDNKVVLLRDVKKIYYRDTMEVPVLDGINLSVREGEFLVLMGPSGSGKTTLLNLIGGIDSPTGGEVIVAGETISRLSEKELAGWRSRNIGFIFQLYNLIPVLTAYQNVELPLLLTGLSGAERREHTQTALEVVGLTDRADHYPKELSGGQEQRVAIARAIVSDPTLLLADEPTGDLDAASASEILDLIERLNAEYRKTIILVTHDQRAASRAGRMMHLDKGVLTRDVVGKNYG
jgi:putative ABC transport system ATP-binding protein